MLARASRVRVAEAKHGHVPAAVALGADREPAIGGQLHEVREHDIGQMRAEIGRWLIARERKPDERPVGAAVIDLDVAVPKLTNVIEEDVVRRDFNRPGGIGSWRRRPHLERTRRLVALGGRRERRNPRAGGIRLPSRERKAVARRRQSGDERRFPDGIVAPLRHVFLVRLR